VWAGVVYLLHLYLSWIYDQAFAHLADDDQLDRHGQEIGVFRKPATFANGLVTFAGTTGTVIPQGTLLQTVVGRVEYQTTQDVALVSGIATVSVTAIVAGSAGNQESGVSLELVSPIVGVDTVTTSDVISEGAEIEDDESYRERILYKKRNPPQGGADADYVLWATSVSPVTDCWVYPQYPEANSVTLRVANYNASPPILSPSEVQDVVDYVTDRSRKPVTADVRVASVQMSPIVVRAQIRPYSTATMAAADTELRDLFSARGKDTGEPGTPGTTLARSQVQNAISSATGVTGAVITEILQDGVAVTDIALTLNFVANLSGSSYTELA
jgi:uncharacterized phage protein gp47/JayE